MWLEQRECGRKWVEARSEREPDARSYRALEVVKRTLTFIVRWEPVKNIPLKGAAFTENKVMVMGGGGW